MTFNPPTIQAYLSNLFEPDRTICDLLLEILNRESPIAESKIWHRHHWIDNENIGHRVSGSITLVL